MATTKKTTTKTVNKKATKTTKPKAKKVTTRKTTAKKDNTGAVSHENFAKFLITIIIFLSVIILLGAGLVYKKAYKLEYKKDKTEMMEEANVNVVDPIEPQISTDVSTDEIESSNSEETIDADISEVDTI